MIVPPCQPAVSHAVLPVWARAGFSERAPRPPHTLARGDRIAAILFGDPLQSPPPHGRSNKILWVSHRPARPGSDLRIRARRMRGSTTIGPKVVRVVRGGPGPSIVNVPAAGCWRLSLSWSGRHDTVDLDYR